MKSNPLRNMIVNSFEIVLWAVLVVFIIGGTMAMPVIGTIIGLVVGTCITGFGFIFISINSGLKDINAAIKEQNMIMENNANNQRNIKRHNISGIPSLLNTQERTEIRKCPNCKRSYNIDQIGEVCSCGLRHA